MKLKPEDLKKISDKMEASTNLRSGAGRAKITVHMGTCGIATGSRDIMKAFLEELETSGQKDILFTTSGCAGLCSHEPMATIEIKGESPVKYVHLTKEKVKKIFDEHVMKGNIVEESALGRGSERVG
ncbi:MAG: (2Fe-2S) ferredoxin domain-containing protein [Spirochaetales bacterium]|nr:(2Fe-2S) ferredoxin domain-containing protein [Spirochaetales bacterium]